METQSFRAMGSRINAIWDCATTPPPAEWHTLPALFEEWEQVLSRFRPDSELSRLNQHGGKPTQVSKTLAEVLNTTQWAATYSEGMVLPTLLPQLEATGYTQDFKAMVANPAAIKNSAPPPQHHRGEFSIEPEAGLVTLPVGVRVDVGGVAKGWAADKLAARFGTEAPVLIEVGGDIAVRGLRADGSPWAIAVSNPLASEDAPPVALALLTGGGIATSGRDYRQWRVGVQTFHHIIDPRTGVPADTDVLTATVIAPSTLEAEVAAKVVLIRGSHAGLQWVEERPSLAALVICANGHVNISERWKRYDWAYLNSQPSLTIP